MELLKTTKAPRATESSTSERNGPAARSQPPPREAKAEAPINLPKLEDRILKEAKFKKIRSRDLRILKD